MRFQKVTPRVVLSRFGTRDSAQRDRIAVRILIIVALLVEFQSPRIFGDHRATIALVALVLVVLTAARFRRTVLYWRHGASWPIRVLTVYCVWCLSSALWSPHPYTSILQAGLLLLALTVCTSYARIGVDVLAREFVRIAILLAVVSWLMVLIAPDIAVLPDVTWRLNGPMRHSQRLALVMGAAIIVVVWSRLFGKWSRARWSVWALSLLTLVVTLLATQTRAFTAFVLVTIGVLVFVRLRRLWQLLIGGVLAIATGVLLAVPSVSTALFGLLGRDGSNTATLSGRTTIWQKSIEMIAEQPLHGYGFASFYSDLTHDFFSGGYIPPHAHNTFIQAAFETGLIGALLLAAFMVMVLLGSKIRQPSLASVLMLFALLCGMTGIVYGEKLSTLWILITVIAISTWQPVKNDETDVAPDRDTDPADIRT